MNKGAVLLGVVVTGAVIAAMQSPVEKSQPINTGGAPVTTGETGPLSVGQIDRLSIPNYETWTRKQWSEFYRDYYATDGPDDAGNIVWTFWNMEANPNRFAFKNKKTFIHALASYQPQTAVSGFNITANSQPVYDTWYNSWYHSSDVWGCEQWEMWYDALYAAYGAQQAKSIWVNAWTHEHNWYVNGAGQYCGGATGLNCNFINNMRQNGIDVALMGADTFCNLISIPANVVDAGAAATKGAKDAVDTLAQLLPIGVVVATGFAIAWGVKQLKDE